MSRPLSSVNWFDRCKPGSTSPAPCFSHSGKCGRIRGLDSAIRAQVVGTSVFGQRGKSARYFETATLPSK
jgi:hypothetical protein